MSEDPASPHFALFRECFQRAAAAVGGAEERFISVAGVTIRFAFAGQRMLDVYAPSVMPPLRISDPGSAGADVSIEVFDTETTGIPVASLPWREEPATMNHVARYEGKEVLALHHLGRPGLTLVSPGQGVAVHHVDSGDSITWVDRGTAFRFAMHALLGPFDRHLVHGAVVGAEGRGLLIAGQSGAGKSTLSVACLEHGLQWVGDDYVVLEPGIVPVAHAMHVAAKLVPDSVKALGIERRVRGQPAPPDNKAVLIISPDDPGFVTSLPLRGILIPRIGQGATGTTPASAGQAFSAIAPSTMCQPSSRSRAGLAALGTLVSQVPAVFIDLGPDHESNVATVREAALGF